MTFEYGVPSPFKAEAEILLALAHLCAAVEYIYIYIFFSDSLKRGSPSEMPECDLFIYM